MIDLEIRKAGKKDKAPIMKLIKETGLFVPCMRFDDFFVAYRGENLIGVAKLKTHSKHKIHELSSVGIKDGWRKCGIGTIFVNNLLEKTKYDLYLNTVNPGFYQKLGFIETEEAPKILKKNKAWCKACDKTLCRTMVKKTTN